MFDVRHKPGPCKQIATHLFPKALELFCMVYCIEPDLKSEARGKKQFFAAIQ